MGKGSCYECSCEKMIQNYMPRMTSLREKYIFSKIYAQRRSRKKHTMTLIITVSKE
jgi:cytochrome c553